MRFLRRTVLSAAAFALAAAASAALPTGTTGVSPVAAEKKKVLVFSRIEGFNHKASVAACKEMMAAEAEKGAFAVTSPTTTPRSRSATSSSTPRSS